MKPKIENAEDIKIQLQNELSSIKDALNAISDAFIVFDSEDCVVAFNSKQLELFPSVAAHIKIGMPYRELILAQAKSGQIDAAVGQEEAWVDAQLDRLRSFPGKDIEQKFSDGKVFRLTEYSTPSGGRVAVRSDITEINSAQEKLIENQNKFSRAFNANPLASTITTTEDAQYIDVNVAFEKLTGFSRSEVIGLTTYENNIWPNRQFRNHLVAALEFSDNVSNLPTQFRTKTGEIRDALISMQKIDVGGVDCILGFFADVTEEKRATAALRHSEEKYRNLTDGSVQGVIIASQDRKILFCNNSAVEIFGYESTEEIIDLPNSFDLVAPQERDRVSQFREARFAEVSAPAIIEFEGLCKNGEIVPLQGVQRILDWEGQAAVQYTLSDITEKNRAEDELRKSEARFSDFAHASSDWFWETDPEGRLRVESEISDSAKWHSIESAVGRTREEIAGDLVSETDWQPYREAIREGLEFKNFEYCYIGADHITRYARISGKPIFGENGEYIGHRGVASNISEIKHAEKSLRQSEEHFRSLVEGSLQGMLVVVDDIVVYANSAAAQIFGYLEEEIFGVHGEDLIAPKDLHRLRLFRGSKKEGLLKVAARRKDGSFFDCETMATNIEWNGKPARLSTLLDVTDRERAEERLRQAQKMEAVGHLTGGVAHDFNNLLAVMIGHAELLGRKVSDDEDATQSVDAIIQAVERASSLTGRLLAFSRQQTLSPIAADASRLIGSLDDMLRRTLGETINLKIVNGSDLWLAEIDPHQFESAVINLAINARDAMPKGGLLVIETANVTVDETFIEQQEEMTPGDFLEVSVSDNGTGIPTETLAKVFDPFFTTKEVGKGSGLGLSMVYGFAKQSNGHVTIYSEVGHGTTVKLYLPRSLESIVRSEAEADESENGRGSERIIIVEDESSVREISVKILSNQGYDIVEAENGDEAIAQLNEGQRFDLLFTDLVLPGGMNGVEVAEAAKQIQPSIKVLYTTGYAENAVLHKGQFDSAFTLVNKPYRRTELLEKVRAMLDSD